MRFPEFVYGNLYVRPTYLDAVGDRCDGHTHHFDHMTFVSAGSVRVVRKQPNGREDERVFDAPDFFLVKAECHHTIIAREADTVFFCIYAHRKPQATYFHVVDGFGATSPLLHYNADGVPVPVDDPSVVQRFASNIKAYT